MNYAKEILKKELKNNLFDMIVCSRRSRDWVYSHRKKELINDCFLIQEKIYSLRKAIKILNEDIFR